MTPEQIREEAIDRVARSVAQMWADVQEMFESPYAKVRKAYVEPEPPILYDDNPEQWRKVAEPVVDALGDLLPAGGIRYAVAHPVTGVSDPRFVGYTLEECKEFATEYDTHVIEQHLTEWTTHE